MTHQEAFDKWAAHVLKWEGGYVNDPEDSGGETNKGVTWEVFQAIGPQVLPVPATYDNFRNLTDNQVKFFLRYFWDRSRAGEIADPSAAAMIAEMSWHSGGSIAGTSLQRVINQAFGGSLAVDGAIGPLTLAAANAVPGAKLLAALLSYREWWLNDLAVRRPKDQRFIDGWMNRLNAFAGIFAGSPALVTAGKAAGMGLAILAIVLLVSVNNV